MASVALDSCFMAILLLTFALQRPESIVSGSCMCVFYALFRRVSLSGNSGTRIGVLSVALICFISVLRLDHGFVPVFYLVSTVAAFCAADHFASSPLRHVRSCIEIVFWFAFIVIACGAVLNWEAAEPLGELISGSSTNGLPSYLIVVQTALSIAVFLERSRLPVSSAVATSVVAIVGLGRGSIIIACSIFAFSFFYNIFFARTSSGKNISRGFLRFIVLSAGLGVTVYIGYFGIEDSWVEGTKFSGGVLDQARGDMLNDYLRKLDLWSLLFGTDYAGTSINRDYGGNPHNSYIRLHSFYGLFGLLLVVFSPFAIFASNKHFSDKKVIFVLIVLVLIRASTEPILFPTLLDFYYFLYFFLFLRHARPRLPLRKIKCLTN